MSLRLYNRIKRPSLFVLLAACLSCSAIPGHTAGDLSGRALALIGGTLIDGTGADPVQDAAVVIRDGRILAAGKRSEVAIPDGAKRLDVKGATILPGLIDTHVHNTTADNLMAWAEAGVTTVRDVGAPDTAAVFAMRRKTFTDLRLARLIAAGQIVTVPGGYPIASNNFPSLAVASPDDAREKINRLIDQGADLIKIALEGWPALTAAEVVAIVDAAHRRGVPVSAHATRIDNYRLVIAAGVDDLAHSCTDRVLDDDLITHMIRQDIMLAPTLDVQGGTDSPPENLRRFIAAGGRVALGTDAGYLRPAGLPFYEMLIMEMAGMTPMQVIVACTGNAAQVCRRELDLGTLAPGKLADLLVVRGDPLKDLEVLKNVVLILREGVIIWE